VRQLRSHAIARRAWPIALDQVSWSAFPRTIPVLQPGPPVSNGYEKERNRFAGNPVPRARGDEPNDASRPSPRTTRSPRARAFPLSRAPAPPCIEYARSDLWCARSSRFAFIQSMSAR
jgi:hypothetical protein